MLLTVKQVAEELKTNVSYVYKLLNAGLLPYIILGSKKVRRIDLAIFIKNNIGKDLTDPTNIKEVS